MKTITIRDISDETLARIKKLADAHCCSIEEETAAILENAVAAPVLPPERYILAQRIAAMTPKGVEQSDSTEIIRKARDEW